MEKLNKSLANELIQMAESDRAMRMKVINGEAEWDDSMDHDHQARLIEIVDEYGWPTISKVGVEASNAAWLLIQHAPDLQFMERCLQLMEGLPEHEINPANIAYLKDRVLVMNGKPQIYGTQFQGFGKDMGEDMHVYPIEDPDNVDERRAKVGLGSFADNEARVRKLYNAEEQ